MNTRFLLVSDIDGQAWFQLLAEALSPLGAVQTVAPSEALALIQQTHDAVVIVDATTVEGEVEFISRALALNPDAKMVVVTAAPTWSRARAVLRAGAIDYLSKSTDIADLRNAFQRIAQRLPRSQEVPMKQATILFADNNRDFLDGRAEFLEGTYRVLKAYSPAEAENLLREHPIHLAILDIRLTDDTGEDVSGLALAQKAEFRTIPKIMLTGFPSWEYAQKALGRLLNDVPPAVDVISKQDGPEIMLHAVAQAFAKQVPVNWHLAIDWGAQERHALVKLIEPESEGERWSNRANELEDLLRRLFYAKDELRIERLLWRHDGRVALGVLAHKQGVNDETLLVICGRNALMQDERRRYESFAPKAASRGRSSLSGQAETMRFAAHAYTLADVKDLQGLQSLAELYRTGSEKTFNDALRNLFEKMLVAWHENKFVKQHIHALDSLYRERLGLTSAHSAESFFEERFQKFVSQLPANQAEIKRVEGKLSVKLNGQEWSYSDPVRALCQTNHDSSFPDLIHTPGLLSGDNVLTDAQGRIWLTDFAQADLAPALWNFVGLEASIRFDWAKTNSHLPDLHALERCLSIDEFARPDLTPLEPIMKKPARAIKSIRQLAKRTIQQNFNTYHYYLGIWFHAAQRIAQFNMMYHLNSSERTRLAHLWLSLAILAQQLECATTNGSSQESTGIHVDKETQAVWVNGRLAHLSKTERKIFFRLYEKVGQPCKRAWICEVVFSPEESQKSAQKQGWLNINIRRIRREIEPDPESPRYLITVEDGYQLESQPKV